MSFSIEQFKAAVGKRGGMMRDNRFVMTFNLPAVMRDGSYSLVDVWDVSRDMEFWVNSVTLPGYQIGTHVTKRWTYGPDEKRPIAPIYMPFQCTFNADADGQYLRFFNDWLQYIMPHDWYTDTINQQSNYGGRQYEIEYKSNYATDISIASVNSEGEIIDVYFLKEAFPSQLADIPLSYDNNGNAKFNVIFEYLDWTTTTYKPGQPASPSSDPGRGPLFSRPLT